jgi:predicted HTH transcriptional regulator
VINKPFAHIEKSDIDALVTNEVREGRMLDYKEKVPGSSDSEKTEFIADVSSFANATGGYIVYGVRERRDENGKPTGIPESADGLEAVNADSEILRLESSIRTGLDPRVPGIRTKAVEGFTKGPVLVLWIPKSWLSPHMVIYKNHSRFYSRSSNGKYALDVTEIRSAFTLSESLADNSPLP